MEETYFSETSADFQRTTWHYTLGERTLPAFIIPYNEVIDVTFISDLNTSHLFRHTMQYRQRKCGYVKMWCNKTSRYQHTTLVV
jgi:hypothetical protein